MSFSAGKPLGRVLWFLGLTFGISWGSWGLLYLLVGTGAIVFASVPGWALFMLGGFGPTIAIVWLKYAWGELRGVRDLLRYAFGAEHWPRTLAVLAAVLAVHTLVLAATSAINSEMPWYLLPASAVFTALLGGGLEELGWRGFLQPAAERRLLLPLATLGVGAIWAVWHLPLFLIPGSPQSTGSDFFSFASLGLVLSFLLMLIRRVSSSVVACVIFHGCSNALLSYFVPKPTPLLIILLTVETVAACLLAWAWERHALASQEGS
ncbi:MAG: CPBP family intramembrane metalloprotease [Propionibacteriaceae bacterium]|jgi:membrane protease YdiL (CAAX protease family)|nr:CPBP family intramembrane metalloprotease [Propionibacteriaceae bacterium]